MSDGNYDMNSNDGGGLRKQLEETLAANKALRERVETFEAAQRVSSVENYLSSQGLPKEAAKFVPADVTDVKAMETWVSENGKLFTAQQTGNTMQSNAGEQDASIQVEPSIDMGHRDGWTKIERVAANGATQPVDMAALESQISGAKSPAELMALMRQYQIS